MSTHEESRERPCPECGGSLKKVYAEANYGRYLLLDQCQNCGGIWFDRWELYFLKEDEANRLDPVDREMLFCLLSFVKGSGLCPECKVDLEPFKDPNLPKDAKIERCPQCNGLWLNRGELKKYKEHKAVLRKRQQDLPQQRQTLIAGDEKKRLEALQNLGKALSTRVTPQINVSPALNSPEIEPAELAKDLVFVILQALLRLVLKI